MNIKLAHTHTHARRLVVVYINTAEEERGNRDGADKKKSSETAKGKRRGKGAHRYEKGNDK